MGWAIRCISAAALLGFTAGAAVAGQRSLLPAAGLVAPGVRVAGIAAEAGETHRAFAERRARTALDHRVVLHRAGNVVLDVAARELGADVDVAALAARIARIAHEGDVLRRLDDALGASRGAIEIFLPLRLSVEPLAALLERHKEEEDIHARSARLDLATHTASGERAGKYADVYATALAVERALTSTADGPGAVIVGVVDLEVAPRATAAVAASVDTTNVLARFETRFGYLGAQAGRATNISRAASLVEGLVLMPGDVISFNEEVGPRSPDNGFQPAPEIYRGEMREGIGGGTCQVAGTLHAAAFFAGLDVVERSNHSRPSGYIRMGLDATVVYPIVDLKLSNPYEFPVVIHSTIDKGTLRFELLGRERRATVELGTDTVGVAAFKRKVEEAPWLPPGKVVKKQRGIRGITIKKTRRIQFASGEERVEVTTDVYPPTFEIYLVPPGTNVDEELPPLEPVAG